MKEFTIPVSWQMAGEVKVTAHSLSDAIERARQSKIPEEREYIDDSFRVDEDLIADEEGEPVWVRTDDLQWVMQEDDDNFVVLETTLFPDGKYVLQEVDVDISHFTSEELEKYVCGYHDSLDEVKKEYKEEWKQVVAEIVGEQQQIFEWDLVFKSRKDLFKHLQEKYEIEAQEGDLIEEE